MHFVSLFVEDSPMSDLKMDISGSCSSESPANTTPDAMGKGESLPFPSNYLESDPDDGLRILKSLSDLENYNAKSQTPIDYTLNSLDNRRAPVPSSQLISVHSHPLMSPDECPGSPLFPSLRLAHPLSTASRTSPKRHSRLELLEKDTASAVSVSSDSEADLSQYQANVGPSFQCVALVSKQAPFANSRPIGARSSSCSKIDTGTPAVGIGPRESSIESLSVRSFDELDGISLSRSSSNSLVEAVQLEEGVPSANGRSNHHKIVLADGSTREIDMKVIEPYKRVLSHGGYLKDDCQNAILIFSSCFLPDRSRADYRYVMDSLFL